MVWSPGAWQGGGGRAAQVARRSTARRQRLGLAQRGHRRGRRRKKERKNWQEGDGVAVLKAQGFVCTSVRTDDGGLDSDDGGRNARNRGLVAKGERFYGLARTHLPWSCDCLRRHRSRCACKPPLPTLLTSSALRCCSWSAWSSSIFFMIDHCSIHYSFSIFHTRLPVSQHTDFLGPAG